MEIRSRAQRCRNDNSRTELGRRIKSAISSQSAIADKQILKSEKKRKVIRLKMKELKAYGKRFKN